MSAETTARLHRVLKSRAMQEQLLGKGYFTVPLLDKQQVEACLEVFRLSDVHSSNSTRYNSMEVNDYGHRKFVHDEIERIVGESVLAFFEDYKFLGFNLAVKKPGLNTEFPPHIDDVHADEDQFVSVNVWMPLVDVNKENGTLYFVPKSHLLPQPLSGIGIEYPFTDQEYLFEDKKVFLDLKAGEAAFFHSRIAHGSGSNSSGQIRTAIIAGLIPREAHPFVYMKHDGLPPDKVGKYEAGEKFFLGFDVTKDPDGLECYGLVDFKNVRVSNEELMRILE
jgi:hypothetical protein